jgi:hypothetical protein
METDEQILERQEVLLEVHSRRHPSRVAAQAAAAEATSSQAQHPPRPEVKQIDLLKKTSKEIKKLRTVPLDKWFLAK